MSWTALDSQFSERNAFMLFKFRYQQIQIAYLLNTEVRRLEMTPEKRTHLF